MKRLISCILLLSLLLSLAATAGAEFYDEKDFPAKYRPAIDYVAEKGIISGFPDRTFKAAETLTRAQAAKILCVALEGAEKANAVKPAATEFTDVPQTHWASGYVAYCAKKSIVAGVGSGKYDPDGKLSSAAFAQMLLVAYGHDPAAEGLVGAQWAENTDKALKASGNDVNVGTVDTKALDRAVACQLTENFVRAAEEKALEAQGYPMTTYALTDKQNYRVLGRAVYDDKGLICDFSASGVEFTLDCAGTIWVTLSSSNEAGTRFRVYVDGIPGESITFTDEMPTHPMYADVKPGVHTIRVVKDVPATAVTMRLEQIAVCSKKETIKPTAEKSFYMEVIGDSITGGSGLYGPGPTTTNSSTAALSFATLAADMLGADLSIVSRGGIGLVKTTGGATIGTLYDYQNYYRDKETKYSFARKPNVVVVAIGTNDKADVPNFAELLTNFIDQIRTRYNDKSLKIVVMYHMMNERHIEDFEKVAAADPLCWATKMTKNQEGYGKHPSADAHKQYAMQLAVLIKGVIGLK